MRIHEISGSGCVWWRGSGERENPWVNFIRTFPSAVELDSDALVHVFLKIEDVLLLGALLSAGATRSTARARAAAASLASASATAPTAAASAAMTSVRHYVSVVCECGVERLGKCRFGVCCECVLVKSGGLRLGVYRVSSFLFCRVCLVAVTLARQESLCGVRYFWVCTLSTRPVVELSFCPLRRCFFGFPTRQGDTPPMWGAFPGHFWSELFDLQFHTKVS